MHKHKKSELLQPLDDCSRVADKDGISEYVIMLAISRMKTEEFTSEELQNEINEVVCSQALSALVDKGLVKAVWDPEQDAVVFYAA